MRKFLTWYAQYFNRRHRRTGHLFENRYKSILCDEDNYLLALIRYIHLNPVRANIVTTLKELDSYSWSGHQAVMENAKYDWMDTAYILSRFAIRKKAAKSAYYQFMAEGMAMGKSPELTGGGRRRKVSTVRAVIAKRSLDELGLTMAEIARHLGVTTSSIAKAVARFEEDG